MQSVLARIWTRVAVSISYDDNDYTTVNLLVKHFKYSFHHHHHHLVLLSLISVTLSRYYSLSFIASGRSSVLHPISSQSCCMYVRAGRPAFARPYVGVHRSTSLMSSSLLLQQCPACLVHLTWIVFVIGGRWPYSLCLVGGCCQYLFNNAHKTEYMCFNQTDDISTLDGTSLKLVDKFTYLRNRVSSTEKVIDGQLTKAIDHMKIRPDR